jgi:hypothetical protein
MTDDFADRMRALPPTLPDVPDRVERVHRLVSRRRRRQVGIAAVATALAVVIPVALVSGLPSGGNRHAEQHLPTTSLATVARNCPAQGLSITALSASARMTHTAAQVRTAIAQQHTGGHIVGIYPALVKDPFASKLGLGSATVRRRMWVVYTVRTTGPERSTSGPGPSPAFMPLPNTKIADLTLLDDATLRSGGDLACKPVSAVRGNVGYLIANGAQVGGTGVIGPAGGGFVLCFVGAPFMTLGGPGPNEAPACSDQVALSGDTDALAHWTRRERYVRGTWQAGGLRVRSIGAPQADYTPATSHNPPCRTPVGGWAQVPPSPDPNVNLSPALRYRRQHPGVVVGYWIFRPTKLTPVMTIASTDPAATRTALASAYPRALCVVPSHYSLTQVHQANLDLQQAMTAHRLPGVWGDGQSVSRQGQVTVFLATYSVRPEYRQVLAMLPPGMLVVQPWLRTLSPPPR